MSRKITKEQREKVYQKYNGHCAYCGKKIAYKEMQVDHLVPLADYPFGRGENTIENMMPACRRCNHYKRAKPLEDWRRMIEEIPNKLDRDSYIYKVGVDYGLVEPKPRKIKFYFEQAGEQE